VLFAHVVVVVGGVGSPIFIIELTDWLAGEKKETNNLFNVAIKIHLTID
jgi:hypothetical protein